MNKQEHTELVDRFKDEFTQEASRMGSSRIGGQVKRIAHMSRDPLMSERAPEVGEKLIDGVVLKVCREFIQKSSQAARLGLAKEVGVKPSEIDEYHFVNLFNAHLMNVMYNVESVVGFGPYVEKKGFEDLILFILAVGDNLKKSQLVKDLEASGQEGRSQAQSSGAAVKPAAEKTEPKANHQADSSKPPVKQKSFLQRDLSSVALLGIGIVLLFVIPIGGVIALVAAALVFIKERQNGGKEKPNEKR